MASALPEVPAPCLPDSTLVSKRFLPTHRLSLRLWLVLRTTQALPTLTIAPPSDFQLLRPHSWGLQGLLAQPAASPLVFSAQA